MRKYLVLFFCLFCLNNLLYAEGKLEVDFNDEIFGAPSQYFSAFVGSWHIDKDENNLVYAVDGRRWEQGLMADGIATKAKALYGERYAEFLDNLEAYKYFPLSIYKGCDIFNNGTIEVSFKAISGRIDQGAGIAFNIKGNGDHLVIRANPLERNLVLFKLEKGRRSTVKWIRGVSHKSKIWYNFKVIIKDNYIEAYLDDTKYLSYTYKDRISGKIGLWSKADSYVFF